MTAADLLMAAMLLTSPVDTPEPVPPEERWVIVRDAVHKTAVDWELMDPRETRYVLATRDDFTADLNLLRKRYADLAGAPKLADCRKLPDRRTVNELIAFNRAYRKHLEQRQAWEPDRAAVLTEAILETDRLYKLWDSLRDAQCDFYYVTVRREALKRYRAAVGQDAYTGGFVPPFVPDWQFATIR